MNEAQRELAKKILAQVEERPELLEMSNWEYEGAVGLYDWKAQEEVEGCGTTRCIAGWAIHFSKISPSESTTEARGRIARDNGLGTPFWERVGAHLLGLDDRQADKLFLQLDEEGAVDYLKLLIQR